MYTKAQNNLITTKRLAGAAAAARTRPTGWWLVCWLLLLAGSVHAATVTDLYDGVVRVRDRTEATRNTAFSTALGVVLTKVSGRADAPARVGVAVNNAARYVQRYGYLSNGQLEVGFDSAAVNALLDQAGLPLWDRERPATLVIYPAALQGVRESVMATEQTAKVRGVPIVWASESSEQFPATALSQLQELARRYDAVAVLVARPVAGVVTASNVRWQMVFNGASRELSGSVEQGPALAAEVLAPYYASAGKTTLQVVMDVSGIDNLSAYARTLAYLNGLLMVRNLSVESFDRDVLRLHLELRGNLESLRRTLAVDQRLVAGADQPVNEETNVIVYRFQSQGTDR